MLKIIERTEERFCALALLFTALLLFVNVVLRYVFKSSTSWAEELIRYLMIWITFVGGSVCVRKGAHIRMDFLMTLLPSWSHKWLDSAVYALAAAFCAALTLYGVKLVLFTIKLKQTSPALCIPMWIPYLAVPIGSALMTFGFARGVVMAFRGGEARQ